MIQLACENQLALDFEIVFGIGVVIVVVEFFAAAGAEIIIVVISTRSRSGVDIVVIGGLNRSGAGFIHIGFVFFADFFGNAFTAFNAGGFGRDFVAVFGFDFGGGFAGRTAA